MRTHPPPNCFKRHWTNSKLTSQLTEKCGDVTLGTSATMIPRVRTSPYSRIGIPVQTSPHSLNGLGNGSPNPTGAMSLHLDTTVVRTAPTHVRHDGAHMAGYPPLQAAADGNSAAGLAGAAFGRMAFRWIDHRPISRAPAPSLRYQVQSATSLYSRN